MGDDFFEGLGFTESNKPGSPSNPVRVRIGFDLEVACCPKCGSPVKVRRAALLVRNPGKVAVCSKKGCGWKAEIVERKGGKK
jgi:ssDNA-binding Zn-finger/Zn-ribbon topoisomerase 1